MLGEEDLNNLVMCSAESFEHIQGYLKGGWVDILQREEKTGQVFGVGHDVVLKELVESE